MEALGAEAVVKGCAATADSFYSSQGRTDDSFPDANTALIPELVERGCVSLEMESAALLHLAAACRPVGPGHPGPIFAAACAMVFAQRHSDAFISHQDVKTLEARAGRAALDALADSAAA